MNELSWLLYLASVSGALQTLFFIMAFALSMGLIIIAFTYVSTFELHDFGGKYIPKGVLLVLILFIVACLLPDKETVYLIAASEVGENTIKSETGQKAIKAINSYLDKESKSFSN